MTYAVKMLAPQKFTAPPNIIRIMNRTTNLIRLHWWSKDTYGSNRQRTENIDPQQYIALPAQDGVQWTLSEEDYSTFCWITGMRGSVPLNNFSFQAREPFDIKIVADDSVFSNKAQYIYMVVDDADDGGGSEPFRFDAAKYPGLDRNSPAMQRCRDALLAAILEEHLHR